MRNAATSFCAAVASRLTAASISCDRFENRSSSSCGRPATSHCPRPAGRGVKPSAARRSAKAALIRRADCELPAKELFRVGRQVSRRISGRIRGLGRAGDVHDHAMGVDVRVALAGREVPKLRGDEIARRRLVDTAGALPNDDQSFVERELQCAIDGLCVRRFDHRLLFRRTRHPQHGDGLASRHRQVNARPMPLARAANERLAASRIEPGA